MSDMTAHPTSPRETIHASVAAFLRRHPLMRLLFWRLPSAAMLLLALGGVAYTSLAPRSTAAYWQLLAPAFGLICVASDWKKTHAEARWRLIWTQTLHWGAVLLAMRILFFPDIQHMMNSDATGLMVLGLLALGTVLAGVHAAAWEIATVGVILALSIPAIALMEQMTLLLLLGCVVIIAGAALFFWLRAKVRALCKPQTPQTT
jgi:hypothetical protein